MCFLKELNYSTSTPPENSIMLRVPSKTVYTSPGNIISMLFTLQKMVLLFCKPLQEFLLFLTIVQFLSSFSVSPRLRMMQSKGPKEEWKVKGVEAQMCTLQHRYDLKTLGINELQEKKGRRKEKKKKKRSLFQLKWFYDSIKATCLKSTSIRELNFWYTLRHNGCISWIYLRHITEDMLPVQSHHGMIRICKKHSRFVGILIKKSAP